MDSADKSNPRLLDWRDTVQESVAWRVADALKEEALTAGDEALRLVIRVADMLLAVHPHIVKAQVAAIEALVRLGNTEEAELLHSRYATCDTTDTFPPFSEFGTRVAKHSSAPQVSFIGRDEELRALFQFWRLTQEGEGQVALLLGEAGIGKTRLAEQFLRRVVLSGGRVWMVGCCAATQRLPYSAARDLVRDNIRSIAAEARDAVISAFGTFDTHGYSSPEEYRHQLTEALTTAAETTARNNPLVIFVDDAQWADQFTALLLSYWAHRLRSSKVLTILAVRTHEAEPLPEWLALDLSRAEHVSIGQLGVEAAARIVRSFEKSSGVTLDQSTRDKLLWLSAGRPFLLVESLLASITEDVHDIPTAHRVLTSNAESVLRRRFRKLRAQAQFLADFLAVWGKPLSMQAIALTADITDTAAAMELDVLQQRGILQFEGHSVSFVHELMRETAYRGLMTATRTLYHRRAAELASRLGEPAGLIAHHYARAKDEMLAGRYAWMASQEAWSAKLYGDYEYYLTLAVDDGSAIDRQRAAKALAMYLVQVGRTSEVEPLLKYIPLEDPDQRLVAILSHLEKELSEGRTPASELVNYASSVGGEVVIPSNTDAIPVIGMLMDIALDAGAPGFAAAVLDAYQLSLNDSESDAYFQLTAFRTVWSANVIGLPASILALRELVGRLSTMHLPSTRALCHYSLGTLYLLRGRVRESLHHFDHAYDEAELARDLRRQNAVNNNRGVALMEMGRFAEARAMLEMSLGYPSVHVRLRCYSNLAILHYELGNHNLAIDAAKAVGSMNTSYKSKELNRLALSILGLSSAATGDWIAAGRCSTSLQEAAGTRSAFEDTSYSALLMARVASHSGDVSGALAKLQLESDRIRPTHRLASLRLMLEAGRMLIGMDDDKAFATISAVAEEAASLSADHLKQRAVTLRQSLRG
jgi:tetratricopeptide (TPR) repeat protein